MSAPPAPRTTRLASLAPVALAAAAAFAGIALWRSGDRLGELHAATTAAQKTLQDVLGEVTRMRLEQSAGGKGPAALLEKLRTYAPLLADARTTEPDYKNARKEMDTILRAFGTLGADGAAAIRDRLGKLSPQTDFDEIKQLLAALVAVDPDGSQAFLREVLLGRQLPSPRLRWWAADLLTRHDLPLAQNTLRQVLLSESSRGFNPAHAAAFPGAAAPEPGAMHANGFFNYVIQYVRTDDPKMDDTLLQVMGRSEHDDVTVKECIEALGRRKVEKAVPAIERAYKNPPLGVESPIFLNTCLTALVDIQGKDARPFLEAALPTASSDLVAKHIQFLLDKIK